MLLGIRLTPFAKLTKIGKKHRSAAIIILAVTPMPNITRKRGANVTNGITCDVTDKGRTKSINFGM